MAGKQFPHHRLPPEKTSLSIKVLICLFVSKKTHTLSLQVKRVTNRLFPRAVFVSYFAQKDPHRTSLKPTCRQTEVFLRKNLFCSCFHLLRGQLLVPKRGPNSFSLETVFRFWKTQIYILFQEIVKHFETKTQMRILFQENCLFCMTAFSFCLCPIAFFFLQIGLLSVGKWPWINLRIRLLSFCIRLVEFHTVIQSHTDLDPSVPLSAKWS